MCCAFNPIVMTERSSLQFLPEIKEHFDVFVAETCAIHQCLLHAHLHIHIPTTMGS